MTYVGFDDITKREVFCVAASNFGELPGSFALPSKRFVALLVADSTQADVATLSQFAETLLASGCVYFCAWGPGCERAHDIMDECSLDIDLVIMTTWHADESLDEALYFFLRNSWPDEGYSEDGSAVAITVGNAEWAAQVERRLRDRDSLTEDVLERSNQALERTADRRDNLLSMTSTLKPIVQLVVVSGRSAFSR